MTAAAWSPGAAGPALAAEDRSELDWLDRAACLTAGPGLFFSPGRTESNQAREYRENHARAVCAACPVKASCLRWAMEAEAGTAWTYRAGIYGGLNEHERYRIERKEDRAA
jgi:WhiB family redox-sensing transcriptional regulator